MEDIWIALGHACLEDKNSMQKALHRTEKRLKKQYNGIKRMPNVTINVIINGESQHVCFFMITGRQEKRAKLERIYTQALCNIFPEL